jgi:hypothetical protein
MFCGGPIAYKSKVQSTVSTSSTEAAFIAAVHAANIAKYIRSILYELIYTQPGPTMLYEDNKAAILMINASCPNNTACASHQYPALCYPRVEGHQRQYHPLSYPWYHFSSGCPH